MKNKPLLFLNASVVLAGWGSPNGGSAKILKWIKAGRVRGVISEIVLDEVKRHADKVGSDDESAEGIIGRLGIKIAKAPGSVVGKYQKIVKDVGDAHLFVSSEKLGVDYLVSLDKKHVLDLKGKIGVFKIVSPRELIEGVTL